MAELLVEFFSEEIPARMQEPARRQLAELAERELAHHKLKFSNVAAFATPRRLTLVVDGLPAQLEASASEKRGPRVDAPEQAVEGFARSVGVSVSDLEQRETPKGSFYFYMEHAASKPTASLLPELIETVFSSITWPKSMKWGDYMMRWVRPLHHICCLFDGQPLSMRFGHLTSSDITFGHRFLSDGSPIQVTHFEDYKEKLRAHGVILDTDERKYIVDKDAHLKASEKNLPFETDERLLGEVVGLVEYPHVVMGRIDDTFMSLPKEVLTTSMRIHQKYFTLQNKDGTLAPHFITVANIAPKAGGDANIIAGNERVLRARLQDAAFFYEHDTKQPLTKHAKRLERVTFHAKLGSLSDKSLRIAEFATYLSVWIPGAQLPLVERAGHLCKADLVTDMVGEFPELQGIMGGYYARHHGEEEAVAKAIETHYHPAGPEDGCPTDPVSVAIALADKIDTMTGMFGVGEKPTGSKDPFALRRAALGIVRIILENNLHVPLRIAFNKAFLIYPSATFKQSGKRLTKIHETVTDELLAFCTERLRVLLKSQDVRHDSIDAVFDDGSEDDLCRLVSRVMHLQKFLSSDEGMALLRAYRRVANILDKEGDDIKGIFFKKKPTKDRLIQKEEQALFNCIESIKSDVSDAVKKNDFEAALRNIQTLQGPIEQFFEHVTVNCENQQVRKNRLLILLKVRSMIHKIANLSKIVIDG